MFFRLMLWALAKRLEWLSKNDKAFQEEIAQRVCVLQFQTPNQGVCRYFAFAGGKTESKPIPHKNPSIIFTFKSSGTARQLVMEMAKDPEDMSGFMDAMNMGKIRVKGDISLMIWFMTFSDFLAPDIEPPKLPKVPRLPLLRFRN